MLLLVLGLPQACWGFVPALQRPAFTTALRSTVSSTTAVSPPDVPFRDAADVPVFEVPAALRREQQGLPPPKRVEFLSLETLFPGSDGRRLAEAFDEDGRFRCVVLGFGGERGIDSLCTTRIKYTTHLHL